MKDKLQYTMIDGIKCYNPEIASAYSNYPDSGFDLTDQHVKSSFWVSSRNRLFKALIYRHLVHIGKTKLLEIGCGTGDFIQQIVQNKKLEITGSEIYLKGLVYAKKKLHKVDFVQFDVTQSKLNEQFHIITAFDVIEHIENDMAALSNINQMLIKNGILIISVPQHKFLWSKLDDLVYHKRRYSRSELVNKLIKNDFAIHYATSFLFILFPLMLISRIFDKGNDQSKLNDSALEKRVKFPGWLNTIFDLLMRLDEVLIRLGISLPFGGTLVIVAKKL